jgi:protein gp37
MGLNKSKGNMYEFVTHTWNTIKGACPHDCSYCYMKQWGDLKQVRFDEKELKIDLGKDNFIFVGSSCDMWASDVPERWIIDTLMHCKKYNENSYFFQTKNPMAFNEFAGNIAYLENFALCTTIETNRWYQDIMNKSPEPIDRAYHMHKLPVRNKYVTIEPIMDFDFIDLVAYIRMCKPMQVNIGADSGNNNLPEPSKLKVMALIEELKRFTIVHQKRNLNRLLK